MAQEGFGYLWLCLREYSGGYGYFILYLLALSYIIIKGNETEKAVFVPQSILLALTVYNPFFPMLLNRIFDVNNVYYRFFWMLPLMSLVSFASVKIIFDMQKKTVDGVTYSYICENREWLVWDVQRIE